MATKINLLPLHLSTGSNEAVGGYSSLANRSAIQTVLSTNRLPQCHFKRCARGYEASNEEIFFIHQEPPGLDWEGTRGTRDGGCQKIGSCIQWTGPRMVWIFQQAGRIWPLRKYPQSHLQGLSRSRCSISSWEHRRARSSFTSLFIATRRYVHWC